MNDQTSRIYQILDSDYLIVPEDMRDLVVPYSSVAHPRLHRGTAEKGNGVDRFDLVI